MKLRYLSGIFVSVIVLGIFCLSAPLTRAAYGDVTTFASEPYWGDGYNATEAFLDFPEGLCRDSDGNFYVADTYNNVIRKIKSDGKIITLAGSGSYGMTDAKGAAAEFAMPRGVAVDSNGYVYVGDTENNRIRKIAPDGTTSTLIDSGIKTPAGLSVSGSNLYFTDSGNGAVKVIKTSGGAVSTVKSGFNNPQAVHVSGDWAYISDTNNNRVVKVHLGSKSQETIVSSGLSRPNGLWKDGSYLYISDDLHDAVKKVHLDTGELTTFSDDNTMTTVNFPHGIVAYGGYVYVINTGIGTLQKFRQSDGYTTVPGDTVAGADRFNYRNGSNGALTMLGRPYVMAKYGNTFYVAENNKIRVVDVENGGSSFLIGNSVDNYKESTGADARFSTIQGIAVTSNGENLYVADRFNNRIRRVSIAEKKSYWISGVGEINTTGPSNGYKEGDAAEAKFANPTGVVLSADGATLYVADTGNNRIRSVRLSDGHTELIAGDGTAGYRDGDGHQARFNKPVGIDLDRKAGRYLYVADTNNHRIREIDLSNNKVRTIAGSGQAGYKNATGGAAYFSYPEYLAVSNDGKLYISEVGSHRIRWADPASGEVRLVSGSGNRGYKNGSWQSAEFNNPKGIVADVDNNRIFVADTWNDVIRRVTISSKTPPYSESAPTVSGCVPGTKIHDGNLTYTYIKVLGNNFRHGVTVKFNNVNATAYLINSREIVAKIPFASMQKGWYHVTARNTDGQTGTKNMGFGIADNNGVVPNVFPGATGDTVKPAAKGFSFFAYSSNLRGGFYAGVGDVMGDSAEEIVTGTSAGMGPQIMVFDKNGKLKSSFFVYAKHLRSGVRVAVGDVDGDGKGEIVVGPGAGGRPHIRIFNGYGQAEYPGYFALDKKFAGGVWVATGDVNNDGKEEIIVTPSKGGGPQVTIHDQFGKILGNFFAYPNGYRDGVHVAAADTDGDGVKEIVTAPDRGGRVPVRVFERNGQKIGEFYPFGAGFGGGISVAGGDVDANGKDEVIVGAGPGGGPLVRVLNQRGASVTPNFYMYPSNFRGGVNVAAGDVNKDGEAEIIGAPASGGGPNFRIIDPQNL